LTIQATTQQIGYLSSLPNFAIVLMSLFAPMISERVGNRKNFILSLVLVMALPWLLILAIPFVFHTNQVWWLIVFFTLITAASGIVGPTWSWMMADLTPPELRGSYFGLRSFVGGLVTLVSSFIAAGLLQLFTGDTRLAFSICVPH
jgi:MFS family permease